MIDTLTDTIFYVLQLIFDFFTRIVLTIFDLLQTVFITLIDTVMNFVIPLFSSFFENTDFLDIASYFDILPEETKNFLGLIGFGSAFSIIVGALIIKILLQLIPFVRLGSK
jgi:hypothetical protein